MAAAELPVCTVGPVRVGRVTGWALVCNEHGSLAGADGKPIAVDKLGTALAAAEAHLQDEHDGRGAIRSRRSDRRARRKR